MKVTYRIPTKDPYAYVEIEDETDILALPSEVAQMYANYTSAMKGESDTLGIPSKDFNEFLDIFVSTGKPPEHGLEVWEEMSKEQKVIINEIKKTFKRLNK